MGKRRCCAADTHALRRGSTRRLDGVFVRQRPLTDRPSSRSALACARAAFGTCLPLYTHGRPPSAVAAAKRPEAVRVGYAAASRSPAGHAPAAQRHWTCICRQTHVPVRLSTARLRRALEPPSGHAPTCTRTADRLWRSLPRSGLKPCACLRPLRAALRATLPRHLGTRPATQTDVPGARTGTLVPVGPRVRSSRFGTRLPLYTHGEAVRVGCGRRLQCR